MDSEKWFTFRQYGADKEAPEYRVDIEKKDEGTAEAPSIIKEVKGEDESVLDRGTGAGMHCSS